jgi:phosphoglycerate-specific signal transduction histidine kinase
MDENSKLLLTVAIPTLTVLVGILVNNRQLDQVHRQVDQLDRHFNQKFTSLRTEMNGQISALRNEMIARLERVEGVLEFR